MLKGIESRSLKKGWCPNLKVFFFSIEVIYVQSQNKEGGFKNKPAQPFKTIEILIMLLPKERLQD